MKGSKESQLRAPHQTAVMRAIGSGCNPRKTTLGHMDASVLADINHGERVESRPRLHLAPALTDLAFGSAPQAFDVGGVLQNDERAESDGEEGKGERRMEDGGDKRE